MRAELVPGHTRPCLHEDASPIYGGRLRLCLACGLVSTVDPARFDYVQGYFTADGAGGYDFDSVFARDQDAARFGSELQRLEAQGLKGSVLDIGCATGAFLAHAQARGWSVGGVELADFARARAQERLGVPLTACLADLPAGERFDVVTLHHVLEHIQEPLPFLRDEVKPRTKRLLLVEVPNFASLASRYYGSRWHDLRPDQHAHHYTRTTLANLMRDAGFRPVRTYSLWEPLWSLRAALGTLLILRAFLPGRRQEHRGWEEPPAAADARAYQAPHGARLLATRLSWIMLQPLVSALEAASLGERLVLEADPVG
jgi:SAM-dependent methyltransferase